MTGLVRNIGTKNRMLKLEESLHTVIRYLPLVRDSAIGDKTDAPGTLCSFQIGQLLIDFFLNPVDRFTSRKNLINDTC